MEQQTLVKCKNQLSLDAYAGNNFALSCVWDVLSCKMMVKMIFLVDTRRIIV